MAAGITAGVAYIPIRPDLTGFNQAVSKGVSSSGRDLQRVGGTLTRGLTIPLTIATAAAVKLGLGFNESMTRIQALVGASAEQTKEWGDQILDLSGKVGKPPKELADALYFVTSSGIPAAKAISVVEASAKAAASGLGDTATVADAVTSAMNAYGPANLSAARATDILTSTVRVGKAEPAELAEAIGRVIAPAQAMGVSFDEVGGSIAALSLGGLDAAESVTGLRGILSSVIKPSAKARDTLAGLNIPVKDLREEIADKGLLKAMQDLRDRVGDNKDAIGKLFPNVRALNAFLILTGANAEKNAKVMHEVAGSVGEANEAFQKTTESASFKVQQSWARLQTDATRLGAVVIPIFSTLLSGVARVGEVFTKLPGEVQIAALGIGIALGPTLKLVGALADETSGLRVSMGLLAGIPPLALVGVGVVAAVAGVAYWVSRIPSPAEQAADAIRSLNTQLDIFATASGAVNASARELAHARLDEKATAIAVKDATKELARVQRDDKASKLDLRKATLALAQAEQAHSDAVQRRVQAGIDNLAHQKDQAKADKVAADRLLDIADKARSAAKAIGRDTPRAYESLRKGTTQAEVATKNFIAEMRNVRDGATQASPKVRDMAGDILDLTEKLGRVPTQKEIRLALTNYTPTVRGIEDIRAAIELVPNEKTIRLNIETHGSVAAPTGLAEGGGRALGGPVLPFHTYEVGERGRETLVMGSQSGYVIPHTGQERSMKGLRIEGQITDGGYLRGIVIDEINDMNDVNHQSARMRRA